MYNIDKKEIIRTFKLFYTGGSSMKKIRNILAMLMVFVMLVAVMPMNVFADGEGEQNPAPAVTVTSIAIDTSSTYKTEYKVGDSLDVSGLKIKVTKSDNSEETVDVTSDMVTGFDSKNVTESQPLTITYQDKTATYNISIKANEPEAKKFTLTAKVKGEGGKVSPESKKDIAANTKETVTITPNANYEIAEVKVNNEDKTKEVKNNELKLTMNENKDVVVTFKKKAEPKPETKEYTISKAYTNHGSFTVSKSKAKAGETITVTAKPYSGYAVARVYLEYNGIRKNINTYYNGYYYDGRYYGRYNDYNKYLDVYENSSYYLRKYDSYREFLRHEYPSHYRYYEDYDYWTDRYDYDWYDRYDNYYYKYFDDFRRSRYDTYEEYLRAEHYTHYRDYYNYRYDYNWYNRYGYTTTDTFEMPASNVTVYVEFTDAYPYYYDDYYYYRTRRDRKAEEAKAKAEAAKKEEEEAKAKAEAAKQPQIYENKAVISIGSNVLDKVSKNVHTVHQMDTPAYVNGGRVMLPLRYVAEALGLQVSWVPETKTVIIWDLTQRVEIPVKSNRIIVNGITYTSDVKPEIKNERTMLPIANIARALGLIDGSDIVWDQYNKQVTLTRKVLSK